MPKISQYEIIIFTFTRGGVKKCVSMWELILLVLNNLKKSNFISVLACGNPRGDGDGEKTLPTGESWTGIPHLHSITGCYHR